MKKSRLQSFSICDQTVSYAHTNYKMKKKFSSLFHLFGSSEGSYWRSE